MNLIISQASMATLATLLLWIHPPTTKLEWAYTITIGGFYLLGFLCGANFGALVAKDQFRKALGLKS